MVLHASYAKNNSKNLFAITYISMNSNKNYIVMKIQVTEIEK